MSVSTRVEWDRRAERTGLSSVMSIRWSEPESVAATTSLKNFVLATLGNVNGQQLLEVGSGIGRFTSSFQNAGAEVTTVDHSIAMINRARSDSDNVLAIQASAADLPLAGNCFDVSVAITVLQHITDQKEFISTLDELRRVTAGRIIICDEMREDEAEQVSAFTVLRTVSQFAENMPGWSLTSREQVKCISDEYTLMVWESTNAQS